MRYENIVGALLIACARNLVNSNEHEQWVCFTPNGVGLPVHVQGLPEPLAWIRLVPRFFNLIFITMSYLASKKTSIEELAKQYTGRKFGELVLYHIKLAAPDKISLAIEGLNDKVHPKLKETTEDFLKVIEHKFAKSKLLWSTDCGKTLQTLATSTKVEAKKNGLEVDDDYAFDIFNLIVQTLALRASNDRVFRKFIEKSIRRFWFF